MKTRWASALIKTIIFWVITHIIFLAVGFFVQTDIGVFGMPMWWAHWSDNVTDAVLGVVMTIITYLIIYFFFTHKTQEPAEQVENIQ